MDAPDYSLASMGIYIFKVDTLRESLQGQEDDFGKDESKRHKMLMGSNIKVGDEEMPLYRLAKIVNKLPKGVITNVIATATFVEDDSVKKQADDLKTAVNDIEKNRGYFVPEDLTPVDDLARSIIEYILR